MVNTFRRFHDDESGSMIVFTLFVLVLMLVVAGMAVDFMRFESRRAIMQGAVDRAVLAAADLDQVRDPSDVVRDYVEKSQGGNCLSGDPTVTPGINFRSVTANCEMTMDTFFLRLIGMESLTATATATAIEGVGNVEVSLVVDISGSMDTDITSGVRRIDKLEEAGLAFVDTLLHPDYEDRISLSLVPYTAQVNVGPELMDALGVERKHWFSSCIDIPASEFSNVAWNNGLVYEQGQHFRTSSSATPGCPEEDYEQIIPISQDKAALEAALRAIEPRSTTSIFLGLKWGAALLDPSMQGVYASLPSSLRDDAFAGRPVDHGETNGPSGTKKYIVVMTDGENFRTQGLPETAYDTPSEIAHWGTKDLYTMYTQEFGWSASRYYDFLEDKYTAPQGDAFMEDICDAAKAKGIVIYAIAMGSTDHGEQEMSKCASSPSHYYETSGDELVSIFEAIADQITDLRLTL